MAASYGVKVKCRNIRPAAGTDNHGKTPITLLCVSVCLCTKTLYNAHSLFARDCLVMGRAFCTAICVYLMKYSADYVTCILQICEF